jgi:hypothetical protein
MINNVLVFCGGSDIWCVMVCSCMLMCVLFYQEQLDYEGKWVVPRANNLNIRFGDYDPLNIGIFAMTVN